MTVAAEGNFLEVHMLTVGPPVIEFSEDLVWLGFEYAVCTFVVGGPEFHPFSSSEGFLARFLIYFLENPLNSNGAHAIEESSSTHYRSVLHCAPPVHQHRHQHMPQRTYY